MPDRQVGGRTARQADRPARRRVGMSSRVHVGQVSGGAEWVAGWAGLGGSAVRVGWRLGWAAVVGGRGGLM